MRLPSWSGRTTPGGRILPAAPNTLRGSASTPFASVRRLSGFAAQRPRNSSVPPAGQSKRKDRHGALDRASSGGIETTTTRDRRPVQRLVQFENSSARAPPSGSARRSVDTVERHELKPQPVGMYGVRFGWSKARTPGQDGCLHQHPSGIEVQSVSNCTLPVPTGRATVMTRRWSGGIGRRIGLKIR